MPKHFMRIRDLGHSGAWEIIRRAKEMKETNYRGHCMDGKVAALIFEKASTRTRVSFDVAVRQLGGTTIFMTPAESQLGRSEPLRDTARVLSRYVDCLIVRTFGQEKLDELAEYGMVETLSYPFVGDEDYKNFALDADATKKVSVEIANPLAGDRPFLRRDIIPTLAQTVQRNLRRGVENVSLYEIGHVYLWDPNAPAIPALPVPSSQPTSSWPRLTQACRTSRCTSPAF